MSDWLVSNKDFVFVSYSLITKSCIANEYLVCTEDV